MGSPPRRILDGTNLCFTAIANSRFSNVGFVLEETLYFLRQQLPLVQRLYFSVFLGAQRPVSPAGMISTSAS